MLHRRVFRATADPTRPDRYRPYRTVGTALALLVFVFAIAELVAIARSPAARDFLSFWAAGRLALGGVAEAAYDNAALRAAQEQVAAFAARDAEMPFAYPPAFLLLVLPFALLPYAAAMGAWVAATFVPYFLAARRMFPGSGLLAAAFPPVLVNASVGQNGFLTAAVFIGGLLLLPARPFAAGLLFGCLVLKPQLALLFPVALVAARQWRAIAGAALSSAAILLLGLLAFGLAASAAWLEQMPLYARIARDGLVGWHKLASVYAAARQAGLDQAPAFALHGIVALAAAVAVWKVWRSDAEPVAKASVLAAATMLASPYLFLYDAVILVVPLLWLAARGAPPALVAALWLLPVVSIAQALLPIGPVNLNPLVPIVLLALLAAERRGAIAQQSRASA